MWVQLNAIILADADFTDRISDLILFRRQYKGTSDILVILVCAGTAANTYTLKVKLNGVIYTFPTNVIAKNTWT